jgi:hypothetical protein
MSYSCRCFPVLWKWNVRTHCQKSSSFITCKNLEHFQSRIKPVQRFLRATKPRPTRMGSLSTASAADSDAKRSTILPCESQILTCRTPVQVSNTHILRILPGQLHMLVLHLASLCPWNTVQPMRATYSSLRWRLCSKPTLRRGFPWFISHVRNCTFLLLLPRWQRALYHAVFWAAEHIGLLGCDAVQSGSNISKESAASIFRIYMYERFSGTC